MLVSWPPLPLWPMREADVRSAKETTASLPFYFSGFERQWGDETLRVTFKTHLQHAEFFRTENEAFFGC